MRDTSTSPLYIGNHAYIKTTLLIDVEVLEALQHNQQSTPTEVVNKILRRELLEGDAP